MLFSVTLLLEALALLDHQVPKARSSRPKAWTMTPILLEYLWRDFSAWMAVPNIVFCDEKAEVVFRISPAMPLPPMLQDPAKAKVA